MNESKGVFIVHRMSAGNGWNVCQTVSLTRYTLGDNYCVPIGGYEGKLIFLDDSFNIVEPPANKLYIKGGGFISHYCGLWIQYSVS